MICGTSIGGIIALGLASGMKPKELAKTLKEEGDKIFPKKNYFQYICSYFTSSYRPKPLKKVLQKIFEDKQIRDLNTRVIIVISNN